MKQREQATDGDGHLSHSSTHSSHEVEEPDVITVLAPNEKLAEKMKENGLDCRALDIGSTPVESGPFYSYNFSSSDKLITNRGCVRVFGRNIDAVQVIQRF
jgi:hypothetical protein